MDRKAIVAHRSDSKKGCRHPGDKNGFDDVVPMSDKKDGGPVNEEERNDILHYRQADGDTGHFKPVGLGDRRSRKDGGADRRREAGKDSTVKNKHMG